MGVRLFINIALLSVIHSYSQQDSIINNDYITTFQDKISTRISLINTSNSFYINQGDVGLEYKLEQNIRNYIGASVFFRSLEIDYGFTPSFLKVNQDNDDSKLFNLNFRMFHNQ